MDQIQWIFSLQIPGTRTFPETTAQSLWSNIFRRAAANNVVDRFAMLTPNARFNPYVTPSQLLAFRERAPYFNFPPRLTTGNSNTRLSWPPFFRFNNVMSQYYNWFEIVSTIMQRYSQFFRHSASISPTGLGSSEIVNVFTQNDILTPVDFGTEPVPNTDPVINRYQRFYVSNLSWRCMHPNANLEALAMLAAVNVSYRDANRTDHQQGPTDVDCRSGPVWQLPTVQLSPDVPLARG